MKGWFIILLITSQLLFPSVIFTQREEQPLLAMQASQEQPHAVPDNDAEYYDWGNHDDSMMNDLSDNNILGSPYYSYWYWTTGNWWNTRYSFTSKLFDVDGGSSYGIAVPMNIVDV